MSRCCWWGIALVLSSGLLVQSAEAQQFGMNSSPRASCVTDPYGTPFHSWYGSPIAFNSYFYMQYGGAYSSGYNGTSSGYYGGGIPAVASATTSEWVVQRTSVFPIGTFYPWAAYPGAIPSPWMPSIGKKLTQPNSQPTAQRDGSSSPARDTLIRLASGTLPMQKERGQQNLAEGDRLLREGQNSQAYMRYLDVQRDEGNRGDVYFRQAFALVAMGRYSHAVAKLKRGLQVDPRYPRHATTLDEVFGEDNSEQTQEYLQQVARWTNADERDPDRMFLMGVLLHFDEDPRSSDFFDAAWRLTDRRQHLQAFR
ncbi:MAG: hypothetical protein FD138_287 [Planctomycetota bacterium]|nr:MAG: hypothetical protein FD138_287 [Planctomycetota bacterium]